MASSTKSPSEVETVVVCGGKCGRSTTIVDPKKVERPIARLAVGIVVWLDLVYQGFEFDVDAKAWFCVHCRRRRRLVKLLH